MRSCLRVCAVAMMTAIRIRMQVQPTFREGRCPPTTVEIKSGRLSSVHHRAVVTHLFSIVFRYL
jgi:hypothetical protein